MSLLKVSENINYFPSVVPINNNEHVQTVTLDYFGQSIQEWIK